MQTNNAIATVQATERANGQAEQPQAEPTVTKLPTRVAKGAKVRQRKTPVQRQDGKAPKAKAEKPKPAAKAKAPKLVKRIDLVAKATPEGKSFGEMWPHLRTGMTDAEAVATFKAKGLWQGGRALRKLEAAGHIRLTPAQSGGSGGSRRRAASNRKQAGPRGGHPEALGAW